MIQLFPLGKTGCYSFRYFSKDKCFTKNSYHRLTFENINLATYLINLFKNIKIRKIRIKKEEKFTYTLAELITLNKNIKEIECYYIPNFILDYLDNHHIKVKSLSEILYI